MINLEQVKLLETRAAKAVEYVERLTKENAALRQKEVEFQAKIDTYQGRIDELEVLLMRFSEDQGQIEEGILAALDKLSRFEKEMEKSLKEKPAGFHAAASKAAAKESAKHHRAAAHHDALPQDTAQDAAPANTEPDEMPPEVQDNAGAEHDASETGDSPDGGQTCFEIPAGQGDDIPDPLANAEEKDDAVSPDYSALIQAGGSPAEGEELDIF